jgi:hypothetical protein
MQPDAVHRLSFPLLGDPIVALGNRQALVIHEVAQHFRSRTGIGMALRKE